MAALSPTATSKPSAVQAPSSGVDYDSTENMFRLSSGPGHDPDNTRQAISLAVANNDKSMVPVMIEMLRFLWGPGLPIETDTAISAITGRESESASRAWHEWMEWLAKNSDQYVPPDGYLQWKIALMSQVDPRFGEFLAPGGARLAHKPIRDRVGRGPPRRDPGPSKRAGRLCARAGLSAAERPGLRRVHQRRPQGLSAAHRERP